MRRWKKVIMINWIKIKYKVLVVSRMCVCVCVCVGRADGNAKAKNFPKHLRGHAVCSAERTLKSALAGLGQAG